MNFPPKPPHIDLRDDGHPMVVGTGYKVILLVTEHIAWGSDAAELVRGHPVMTREQADAVLEYYQEHKSEMDRTIAERERRSQEILASLPPSPNRAKLLAIKKAQEDRGQ